jgi:hypothetical protein
MIEEQVVEILQVIQAVTPEVAAQAVAYGRWVNGVWAIVCATGDLVGSYIAPDYYAADAVLRMVGRGL